MAYLPPLTTIKPLLVGELTNIKPHETPPPQVGHHHLLLSGQADSRHQPGAPHTTKGGARQARDRQQRQAPPSAQQQGSHGTTVVDAAELQIGGWTNGKWPPKKQVGMNLVEESRV